MTPIVAILTLAAAVAPADTPEPKGPTSPPLELTIAVEQIPLPAVRGPLSVRVDAYESRVTLLAPQDSQKLARVLAKLKRSICPSTREWEGEVQLSCRSQRLSAQLVPNRGGITLDIRELSALPWEAPDQGPPLVFVDPPGIGAGAPCPGDTPAGQAECALAEGNRDEAKRLFREATSTPMAAFAILRLGDLALATGDVQGATRAWTHVSYDSPFSSSARMRLCDLDSKCLRSPRLSMATALDGIPRGLRSDALLRAARREVYLGRVMNAVKALSTENGPDGACSRSPVFCRRILLAAMREPGRDGTAALSLYVDTVERERGPYALELARLGAERALEAGAPLFGANLLAIVAGDVAAPSLSWHLLRTIELYLEGGDYVRARVVTEFARSRLDRATLRQPRWQAVLRARPPTAELARLRDQTVGLEAELATARAALASVRNAAGGGL